MPFFEQVDSLGIIEQTIQRVSRLEEKQANFLLKRFKQIRQDLRDRLDVISGETFSAQQLRGTLVQVDLAIAAIVNGLSQDIRPGAEELSITGARDMVTEMTKFDRHFTGAVIPLNIDTALVGQETSNFLINRYDASLKAYGESLRASITSNLTNLSLQNAPLEKVIAKLGRFFIGEEWKLRRIARTELHNMYNIGKMNTMQRLKETEVPDLKKTMIHPMDGRTGDDSKQLAEENPIIDIDKPFVFIFRRKLASGEIKEERREFMAPPDRPNDRAVLVPFRPSWNN